MHFYDALADCQTDACSFAGWFGGVEYVENSLSLIIRYAAALIVDCKQKEVAVGCGCQVHRTPFRRGIGGIDQQVEDNLVNFTLIKLKSNWRLTEILRNEIYMPVL